MTIPFFSIIVPTYDRPEALTACVQAIGQLDYPQDRFELIIVDDGSLVPVEPMDLSVKKALPLTVLRQSNAGPASARNTGAQHARGDILAFTDDDCLPTTRWLRELAQSARDAPTGLVGGRTMNALVTNPYATASQIIVDEAYAYFLSRESDLRFFATNNMAVSAKLFHTIGGFNPSFRTAEDREFCDRWIHGGHSLVYSPEAIVYHHHHLTLAGFFRQHFHYGRGAYLFHRVRARRGRSRVKPDLRFYALVCRHMLFNPLSWNSLSMAGLMGLWQMANLAGFLWQTTYRQSSSSIYMTLNRSQQTRSSGGEVWGPEDQKD